MDEKSDLFVSYSRADAEWVAVLDKALKDRHVRTHLDEIDLRPSEDFAIALEEGIRNTRFVGLVLTPESAASQWVKKECQIADEHGRPIIPILLKDMKLPPSIQRRQALDFRKDEDFDRNVHRMVWPGITGRPVKLVSIHHVGGFPWKGLESRAKKHGFKTSGSGYPANAAHDLCEMALGKDRLVAVLDIFEESPWAEPHNPPQKYVDAVFSIRERTGSTGNEVVFVLYQL